MKIIQIGVSLLATLLIPAALYVIFFLAPVEEQMGIVQKIFYMHVAAAMCMLSHYLLSGILSSIYLFRPRPLLDGFAEACADTGTLFAMVVLSTGPLWARKAWGAWWSFEPRLTLTLLVFFVFLGYGALRRFGGTDEFTRRIAASIAALSIPAIYFIRVAVELWGGHHPPNIAQSGGYIEDNPAWTWAFELSIGGIFALGIAFTIARARIHYLNRKVEAVWREVQDQDLDLYLEESA